MSFGFFGHFVRYVHKAISWKIFNKFVIGIEFTFVLLVKLHVGDVCVRVCVTETEQQRKLSKTKSVHARELFNKNKRKKKIECICMWLCERQMQNGNFSANANSIRAATFLALPCQIQNSSQRQRWLSTTALTVRLTISLYFCKMYLTSLWCHFPVVTKFTSFILHDDTSSPGRFLLFDGESVPHFSLARPTVRPHVNTCFEFGGSAWTNTAVQTHTHTYTRWTQVSGAHNNRPGKEKREAEVFVYLSL